MVKVTVEKYNCDICGDEASRYTIGYEDGTKVLDRCPRHSSKLERLREEKGEWRSVSGKTEFKVSSVEDIKRLKQ